ncbi:MAG TPA: hypothetical protein VN805_03680 [Caulobacteraceae bacterium]|nr:hypothetical protein [Caulobacteraceae bacterium]
MKPLAVLAAVGLVLAAGTAAAQNQPAAQPAAPAAPAPMARQIVRGVVAQASDTALVITRRDGKTINVNLAPNWTVAVLKPIPVDQIQPGSFIGTTEMPQADGTGISVEVHVFPPGVKMGEGHYPWDLQPGAMMTNGTVGTVTAVSGGRALEVNYGTGDRHVVVPPNAPVVLITPGGDHSLIKAGVSVFLVAAVGPDGALVTNNVLTGDGGAAPPM